MQKKTEFFFTIMGLFFSGVTAYFAYSIGNEQVRAAKIQYAPIFVFKKEYTKDNVKDVYNTEYLSIENQGYPILTFNAVLDTILTLKLTEYKKKTPQKILYYPTSYFDGQSSSSGGKGELSMFIGTNNLWLMSDFEKEVSLFNEKNNGEKIVNYATNTIVKISYIDASDEHHEKYFLDEKPVTLDTYNSLKSKINGMSDLGKNDINLYKIFSTSE